MTDGPGLTRRGFIASAAAASLAPLPALAAGRGLSIVVGASDAVANAPPVRWATELLFNALAARALSPRSVRTLADAGSDQRIVVAGADSPAARDLFGKFGAAMPPGPEALALLGATLDGADTILVSGSDARGLVYAVLDLLDRIASAPDTDAGLAIGAPLLQRPANAVRGIARMVSSEVEDKAWLHDRDFWREYLTMLATHRVNRFSLTFGLAYDYPSEVSDVYLYFAYPFLLAVPGYDVRARGLPDEERDRNLASLQFIAEETALRGIGFQLGLWTHGYRFDSPRVNYLIEGVTDQNHAAYCSDALARLLTEVPQVDGVTLRIHGESGIPEGDYEFWQTVFRGIKRVGRPIGLDLHAKGIDARTVELALDTGMAVTLSPKYMGEHVGLPYHESAIRGTDTPVAASDSHFAISEGSRRFTRYSYGDFMREDRKYRIVWRVWPGTKRLLAWGDPLFFASYGRSASFCGSDGIEIFEPLSFRGRKGSGRAGNRAGYADAALAPARDWQKFSVFYRQWGRLTYDPAEPPAGWRRALAQAFGPAAGDLEAALANASRILPLVTQAHGPSAANNNYWPEIYTNMAIVQDTRGLPYTDTPQPARFGTVESFDPQMFSTVEQAADALLQGVPDARTSPLDVAAWLDGYAATALARLEAARRAQPSPNAEFRRVAIDVEIMAALGRFFAGKFRSAVLWTCHRRSEDRAAAAAALRLYRAARDAWADAARLGAVYADDITYGGDPWLRGHWRDRLPAIDADIAEMARLAGDTNGMGTGRRLIPHDRLWAAIGETFATPARTRPAVRHNAPGRFTPGQALPIALVAPDGTAAVRLHFRHVNQAEPWQVADMKADANRLMAEIPASYTASPFPLQYYFEVRQEDAAALFPGFAPDLANTPYIVVRPSPG